MRALAARTRTALQSAAGSTRKGLPDAKAQLDVRWFALAHGSGPQPPQERASEEAEVSAALSGRKPDREPVNSRMQAAHFSFFS